MVDLLSRVRIRVAGDEVEYPYDFLNELITTVSDRIALRVGAATMPENASSLAVDATVKLLRRQFYEGISSEGAAEGGSLSTSFVEDILAEYDDELARIRAMLEADVDGDALGIPTLRFL